MDDDEPQKTYPLSPAKLSKTPSWVMLGFLLGAAFVWAFKSEPPKPAPTKPTEWPKAMKLPPSPLTTIEAVFAIWGKYTVWEDDVAEVALWRSETKSFSEFYEVRRVDETIYFRSIPKLTRLILSHGKSLPDSPLQFTETERQYREWLAHGEMMHAAGPLPPPTIVAPTEYPMTLPTSPGSTIERERIVTPTLPDLGNPR